MKVPTAAEQSGDSMDNAPGSELNQPTPRYANLEEFRAEFGSYRVNKSVDNVMTKEEFGDVKAKMVTNDPFTADATNQPE